MIFAAVIALKAYSEKISRQLKGKTAKKDPETRCSFETTCSQLQAFGGECVPTWYNLPCSEKIVMCLSNPEAPAGRCQSCSGFERSSPSMSLRDVRLQGQSSDGRTGHVVGFSSQGWIELCYGSVRVCTGSCNRPVCLVQNGCLVRRWRLLRGELRCWFGAKLSTRCLSLPGRLRWTVP